VLIDNVPAPYGQLSDRLYFMHQCAYCWHDYLMDLARANLGDRLRSIMRDGRTLQDVMREVEREREARSGLRLPMVLMWIPLYPPMNQLARGR